MKLKNCLLLLIAGAIALGTAHQQAESPVQTEPKKITLKRMWFCLRNQDKCSEKEIAKAKRWLIKTPTAVIITTLTIISVTVTAHYINKKRQQAIAHEQETIKPEEKQKPEYIKIPRQQRLALRSASEAISKRVRLTCKNVIDLLQYSFGEKEAALAAFQQQYGADRTVLLRNMIESCTKKEW